MSKPFSVSASVDEHTGRLLACYIRLREGASAATKESVPGRAFADYDAAGVLLGVELLGPCGTADLDRVAANESESFRRALRGVAPQELVSA